jgi:hypothetical protein
VKLLSPALPVSAAIGVDLILSGQVNAIGVHTPVTPMWYEPILARLKEMGIGVYGKVQTG